MRESASAKAETDLVHHSAPEGCQFEDNSDQAFPPAHVHLEHMGRHLGGRALMAGGRVLHFSTRGALLAGPEAARCVKGL